MKPGKVNFRGFSNPFGSGMREQTETELHDFILKKLVGDTSEDEIIYEVCNRTGLD
jgi:hypothetical protein